MRTIKITIGALLAVCALGVLAASASAKEKLTFGEFKAQVAGGLAPSPSDPGLLKVSKEDEPELTGLLLGNFKFGVLEAKTNEPDYEEPCEKLPKVTGKVETEKSPTLELDLHFQRCETSSTVGEGGERAFTSFTLALKFNPNYSGELLEVVGGKGVIKTVQKSCPLVIAKQTIPFKMNSEKEYEEVVSYTPESEPVENWETSKKLKEVYPTGIKERLGIELGEKFKGIHTLMDPVGKCFVKKGEGSSKLVEEGPYKGWLEFSGGYIFADIEGIEVKKGELTFVPPAP